MKWFFCKKCGKWHRTYPTTVIRCPFCGADITAQEVGEVGMKKDFIVRRSITMIEGKPHVETYSEHELIRCKDCRNGGIDTTSYPHYWCSAHSEYHEANWFCADGVKKDD